MKVVVEKQMTMVEKEYRDNFIKKIESRYNYNEVKDFFKGTDIASMYDPMGISLRLNDRIGQISKVLLNAEKEFEKNLLLQKYVLCKVFDSAESFDKSLKHLFDNIPFAD